ncbi:MAG: UbiA-like polyprenyltransferase [Desulfonauticus sp.]|nr:UbiA-like polyprenyltransferase [Desulfonauticus sp.]
MVNLIQKIKIICRMIKIEHSVFALPFAYMGLFWSARGWPGWDKFILLTIAMVSVRSFAMTVNRIVDLPLDEKNPRTASRPLVTGEISVKESVLFLLACAVVFVLACAGLNKLCLFLAPFALLWSSFYSYTKRFSWACHFVLGSVLGLAPIAGWIAYAPEFSVVCLLLACGVMFWVAGFDILYALQDVEFDQKEHLFSVPAIFGQEAGFGFASLCHFTCTLFFGLAGYSKEASFWYYLALGLVALILFVEHKLLSPNNLDKVNLAFFTLNGVIAIVLFLGVLADVFF